MSAQTHKTKTPKSAVSYMNNLGSRTHTEENYDIDVLCINCQEMVRVDHINKHSLVCVKVEQQPVQSQNNSSIEDLDQKLLKLKYALEKYSTEAHTSTRRQQDNYWRVEGIKYVNRFLNCNKNEPQQIKTFKTDLDSFKELMKTYNGSVALHLYMERVKVLGKEKHHELIIKDKEGTSNWKENILMKKMDNIMSNIVSNKETPKSAMVQKFSENQGPQTTQFTTKYNQLQRNLVVSNNLASPKVNIFAPLDQHKRRESEANLNYKPLMSILNKVKIPEQTNPLLFNSVKSSHNDDVGPVFSGRGRRNVQQTVREDQVFDQGPKLSNKEIEASQQLLRTFPRFPGVQSEQSNRTSRAGSPLTGSFQRPSVRDHLQKVLEAKKKELNDLNGQIDVYKKQTEDVQTSIHKEHLSERGSATSDGSANGYFVSFPSQRGERKSINYAIEDFNNIVNTRSESPGPLSSDRWSSAVDRDYEFEHFYESLKARKGRNEVEKEQRLFYAKCLSMKTVWASNEIVQQIPVALVYKDSIIREISSTNWERFIEDAFRHPERYINVKQILKKRPGGFQNKLTAVAQAMAYKQGVGIKA